MTHTDIEHEDADLRTAGFDPAAPPAEALARLGDLRAAPGVNAGAIARALGAIASAEAAAMLAAMEAGASGTLRREVRRALYRLRQRGIAPAAVEGASTRPAALPLAFAFVAQQASGLAEVGTSCLGDCGAGSDRL